MSLLKKLLIILPFILMLFIFVFLFNENPLIEVTGYDAFHNVYQHASKKISLIIVKENEQLDYIIQIAEDYSVDIEGNIYTSGLHHILLDSTFEETYVDADIFKNDVYLETFSFYFVDQYEDISFLYFTSFTPIKDSIYFYIGILAVVFAVILAEHYISKVKNTERKDTEFKWLDWKTYTTKHKIAIVFLIFVAIIIPIPFIIFGVLQVLYIFIWYSKSIAYKLKSLILLMVFAGLSGILFVFSIQLILPENRDSTQYPILDVSLSNDAEKIYKELVDDSFYYQKEPLVYFENDDIIIMMLQSYTEFLSFSGDSIEAVYTYQIHYKTNVQQEKLYLDILNDGDLIKQTEVIDADEIYSIFVEELEISSLQVAFRRYSDNSSLFESPIFIDGLVYDAYQEMLFQGGQYIENGLKTYVVTSLMAVISFIVFLMMLHLTGTYWIHNLDPKTSIFGVERDNKYVLYLIERYHK